MTTQKLWPLLLVAAVLLAACSGSSSESADSGESADESAEPLTPITPGELTCEVTADDSFFRLLYANDSDDQQRITGEVSLTLTNGGEHRTEVQSEAIRSGEVLRESYFSAKPIGTTVADCTADLLEIESTEPPENGLDDMSECELIEGDFGDFTFELTVTNSGDDAAYYNGQIAVRNEAEERVVTGFYLLTIQAGVIQYLEPGETLTETFSALGALYSPGHTCELLSANRVGI